MKKGADSMMMPEGSTLYDLIDTGIKHTHAAVGVVVRLRKELSLVKDIPVLFAIDQYNNWFTFSEFEEPVTVRSTRPIHARELAMVSTNYLLGLIFLFCFYSLTFIAIHWMFLEYLVQFLHCFRVDARSIVKTYRRV
ncbi:uncharacterized protein LOC111785716 [Cucurbita pepo subsp. pepo]|uniref:uncharacterized protein LOC111785716 n=1 Tax=Cucurbita pepo subsp. pepo TaxID=3664 RepID=UPI000C9D384E|nr:uncharacterized protein LOC111785716 [Cucurbita pepo subsp. pepo]